MFSEPCSLSDLVYLIYIKANKNIIRRKRCGGDEKSFFCFLLALFLISISICFRKDIGMVTFDCISIKAVKTHVLSRFSKV